MSPRLRPRRRPAPRPRGQRRGYALLTVLLIMLIAGAVALHAALLGMNTVVTQRASDRTTVLDDVALSGIEEARNRLNARLDTVPLSGFVALENDVAVAGTNGVRRSTWVGRRGNTNGLRNVGEFGVMGHIISRATDRSGNQTIRRAEIYQESFARFADFTHRSRRWDGAALFWALGMVAAGPVHSNDTIRVWTGGAFPQAIFREDVTTARIVDGRTNAQYMRGAPRERVAEIPLPSTADLDVLATIAGNAGYRFTPTLTVGDSANVTMRIEFLAIDADGDGNTTGPNDGWFRIYDLYNAAPFGAGYARANMPAPPITALAPSSGPVLDSILYSPNCGTTVAGAVNGRAAEVVPNANRLFANIGVITGTDYGARMFNKRAAFDSTNARCFLGGDERLTNGTFVADDGAGRWRARPAGMVGALPALVAARPDAAFLHPLSAALNPNFRGVIFVEGRVGVSGTVRGRATIASRGNIVVLHNLVQATAPGTSAGGCDPDDDILGLFSGQYVLWGDNLLITPQWRRTGNTGNGWSARKDLDPDVRRPDLAVHAVSLALQSVAAERPIPPAGYSTAQWANRGTLRAIGGQIQGRAGQTGTMSGGTLHGIGSDISFNGCAMQYPPPFYPTTGRWSLTQYFEVNPVGFDPTTWFNRP